MQSPTAVGEGPLTELPALEWRVLPAVERPLAAAGGLLVVVLLAVVVRSSFDSLFWACFAAFALLLSLGRFYFPSRYLLSGEGVAATDLFGTRRLAWKDVRRVAIRPEAAWLSPTGVVGTRRDRRRGVEVLFGRQAGAVRPRLRQVATQRGIPVDEIGGDPSAGTA